MTLLYYTITTILLLDLPKTAKETVSDISCRITISLAKYVGRLWFAKGTGDGSASYYVQQQDDGDVRCEKHALSLFSNATHQKEDKDIASTQCC